MDILLLGAPHIQFDQRPTEALRRKNRALIYYLAAHTTPLSRDQILALFWPDTPRVKAQRILRTMLYDLHKQLGSCLLAEDDQIFLDSKVQVDARQFETGLRTPSQDTQALSSLLELYRGEFLAGFTLPDTASFDDWAALEREHYHELAIHGYAHLSHLYESQRDHVAALQALDHALAYDPLQEDLQREALRLHYLSGDRTGAIRRYEALCKLLSEELGIPPMPETRAVYDAIITDSLPSSPGDTSEPSQFTPLTPLERSTGIFVPFVGRTSELERLQSLSTSGKFTLVEGAPGIGKTRLVNEFISSRVKSSLSAASAPLILRGVAHESEQGLPFQPVVDALRCLLTQSEWPALRVNLDLAPIWLSEILRLVPELLSQPVNLPQPAGIMDEARLWEAILQFIHGLSQRRQLILFMDDLHWADASTLGLIGYLARRLSSQAFMLIGTARPVDSHSRAGLLWKDLLYENHQVMLQLAPLTAEDTLAVARRLSPPAVGPFSRWLLKNAEGNPYFLTELVRHAYSHNVLLPDGTVDLEVFNASQALPPTIENLILSRLIRLSEAARHVIDVAAIIGREFDFELLYRTVTLAELQLSEGVVLDAIDELLTTVMIHHQDAERYSFEHSLTMEVVLQDMSPARNKRLHRSVAMAIEQLYPQRKSASAGSIASHYAQSNTPELASQYAYQAGEYASNLAAWEEAIAFYQQALDIEPDPHQRLVVLLALGNACFHKGDFPQASTIYQTAVDLAKTLSDFPNLERAYLELNKSYLPQSRYPEAIALGRELAESGPPELALCAHFIWGTGLSVESANPIEAEAHILYAQKLLHQQPEYSGLISHTLLAYQLAAVIGQEGKSAEAVALYRKALAGWQTDPDSLDLLRQIMLYNNLAYHLSLLGDPTAIDFVQAGIHLAEERGSLSHLPYLLSTSGEIALSQGDLDGAEEYFSQGLELAKQGHMQERIAGLTANLGLVARQRGQVELARQRLTEALAVANQLGVRHLSVRIRCWLAPLLPRDEAQQELQVARRIAEKSGFHQLLNEITALEKEI